MSWDYSCPKCHAMLNPTKSIILCASHQDTHVMIGLNPQPGKYDIHLPPGVEAHDGEKWEFSCPMCHEDLRTAPDSNLCELELNVDGQTVRILFSRVAGEHATFILSKQKERQAYGEDREKYTVEWAQRKTIR